MPLADEFQRVLGRAPSKAELAFFNKFITENDLQDFEVGEILGALPEAQQKRLPQQFEQYSQALAGQDQALLDRAASQLQSNFAQQGRSITGSGYQAAYANAARDLAISRQPALASFYRQGLQNINQGFQAGRGIMDRAYGLRDDRRDYNRALDMYYRQKDDYAGALREQEQRNLRGSLQRAGIGLGGQVLGGSLTGGINYLSGGAGGFGGGFLSGFGGGR